jgi:PAS domain S-box-containing protein
MKLCNPVYISPMPKDKDSLSLNLPRPENSFIHHVSTVDDPLFLMDPEGNLLDVNNSFAKRFGKSVETCVGLNVYDLLDSIGMHELSLRRRAMGEQVLRTGEELVFEDERDGRVLLHSVYPVRAGGRVVQLFVIVRDVTRFRDDEKQREQLEAQLQQFQKMELVGQLAGGIAHDFNNVLTAILANAEILLGRVDKADPAYEGLDAIRHLSNRSADMVRRLLGFARRQMWSPKIIVLDQELERLQYLLRKVIRENIQLRWHFESSMALVRIDPSQLVQIITNLCINAQDAIDDAGKIDIFTEKVQVLQYDCETAHPCQIAGDYIRFVVRDTGCGIDSDILPHVYEPFYTTKGSSKGTGLGLSTVYGIVKQNGGYIDCQSSVGQGTTFSIYFPEYKSVIREEVQAYEKSKARYERNTVLLVEDEADILNIVSKVLETGGFRVLAARSAEMAISIASMHGEGIGILITDVMLPGMNGIELSRKLLEKKPELKTLFMSGYSADAIGHYGIREDGVHFISKPFSIREFLQAVDRVMQQV